MSDCRAGGVFYKFILGLVKIAGGTRLPVQNPERRAPLFFLFGDHNIVLRLVVS